MKCFWIIAALLLSSCATVDNTYKGTDAGYALITLELDYEKGLFVDKYYHNVSLYYKGKDWQESQKKEWTNLINIEKYRFKSDRDAGFYESENSIGQVALIPLKPGEYVISEYSSAKGERGYIFSEGINIPFVIKPNQITYLGNYHAVETWQRRLFGLKVMVGAYFLVTDTHDRDLKLAKLLNPNVNIESYSINIPELESALSPRLVKERTTKFDEK